MPNSATRVVKPSTAWKLFALAGVAAAFALSIAGVRHLQQTRVVVRALAPNGIEFVIVQRCNWGAELFTTTCYYRKPGGPWGSFYYSHEDFYWGRGKAEVNLQEKQIKIYRRRKLVATFAWETETLLFRTSPIVRKMVGAQKWMPAGWNPAAKR